MGRGTAGACRRPLEGSHSPRTGALALQLEIHAREAGDWSLVGRYRFVGTLGITAGKEHMWKSELSRQKKGKNEKGKNIQTGQKHPA